MGSQLNLLDSDDRVDDVDISARMEQAFLDYSMSVIVGRALPDVRDGLKPVQRRILYAMWEGGLRPDKPYRKCASAVGDVMKKYHPHGDSSIYEALVRMGQDFSSRVPLIDGKGNFGSLDGDGAAAMRYTECRLSEAAMSLLAGIDEEAVDRQPNYDGYEEEPVVLPARFPNLLVNGASGIAVGMATSIPPHNLGEAIDACLAMIRKPSITVDELMKIVPGPDFPTGARIVSTPGIRDAYLTGRGAITVEAVASTETRSGGLPRIVITEIPYQVNKAALLEKMADLVKNKKLAGIRDLRDESSRDGMRIVVELKRGEQPAATLSRLYDLTDLRTRFNANMVALTPVGAAGLQPRTLGLVEQLAEYLTHQRTVLTRRTEYRRRKAAERAHVLEGLLNALDNLDAVIALIRGSDTVDIARTELQSRFDLTEVQATAILDMQLRRLAALERQKIADEHAELLQRIAELDAILADPAKLDALLSEELREIRKQHSDARRSRIITTEGEGVADDSVGGAAADAAPQLDAQTITVFVTAGGYLKSIPARRITPAHNHLRDPVVAVLRATTDDTVLLVDADGGGYRIPLSEVPVATMRQRGTTIAQLLGEGPGTAIIGAVRLDPSVVTVLTVSANGLVKRTDQAEYSGRTRAMIAAGVRDDDRLVALLPCNDRDHVVVAHSGGLVTRFAASDARPMGRGAAGVTGMQVPADHEVVSVTVVLQGTEEGEVVTVAADGSTLRAPLSEYPLKGRGGKGVRTGAEQLAWCGVATDLQVPTDEEVKLLRPVEAPRGRRAGKLTPTVPQVTGQVVGELRDPER